MKIPITLGKAALRLSTAFVLGLSARAAVAQQQVPYTQVSAGGFQSMALRADGTLWTWGSNYSGELGIGVASSGETLPRQVALPAGLAPGTVWTQASMGSSHALAITSDGSLWAWGTNGYGELGVGNRYISTSLQPVRVQAPVGARWLSCVASTVFSLAIRSDGTLWQWGRDPTSPSGTYYDTPQQVVAATAAPGTTWTQVSARRYHILALRSDGTLWAWGLNRYGEVGDGTTIDRWTPVQVPVPMGVPAGVQWVQVTAGREFSLGLLSNGSLYGWGFNADGVLATNTATLQPAPMPFPAGAAPGSRWQQVQAGIAHVTALLSDGSMWTWGENVYGQLVDNTQTSRSMPVREHTRGTWAQVAGGHVHTLAIGADGGVYAGGAAIASGYTTNQWNNGQLGDGTRNGSLTLRRSMAVTLSQRTAQQPLGRFYPNPTHDWLEIDRLPRKATLMLRTPLGQCLLVQPASYAARVYLGGYPTGVYLLTIETADAAPQTTRVVLE